MAHQVYPKTHATPAVAKKQRSQILHQAPRILIIYTSSSQTHKLMILLLFQHLTERSGLHLAVKSYQNRQATAVTMCHMPFAELRLAAYSCDVGIAP